VSAAGLLVHNASEVQRLVDALLEEAAREARKNLFWGVNGPNSRGWISYDKTFEKILGKNGVAKLIRDRKAAGKSTRVLDLFSSGDYLILLDPDQVTAVRAEHVYQDHQNKKWKIISGNLWGAEVWDQLQRGYDLVFIRPFGAGLSLGAV